MDNQVVFTLQEECLTCRPTAMQALFGVAELCAELRADSRYPQPSIRGEYLSAPGVRGRRFRRWMRHLGKASYGRLGSQ